MARRKNPSLKIDPRVAGVIDWILESDYFQIRENKQKKEKFKNLINDWTKRSNSSFSNIWPAFAIHILVGSKYSVMASARSVDSKHAATAAKLALRCAELYRRGGSASGFDDIRMAAIDVMKLASKVQAQAMRLSGGGRSRRLDAFRLSAEVAYQSEVATVSAAHCVIALTITSRKGSGETAGLAISNAVGAAESAALADSKRIGDTSGADEAADSANYGATGDYAMKLLELMHQEISGARLSTQARHNPKEKIVMAKAAGSAKRNPKKTLRKTSRTATMKRKNPSTGTPSAFSAPGFDPHITGAIDNILKFGHLSCRFRDKLLEYVNTPGADFSKVWVGFAVHILEASKYSALASVKKTDYPKKKEIADVILRVARLYKRGGTEAELKAAAAKARSGAEQASWDGPQAHAVWAAKMAADAAVAWNAEEAEMWSSGATGSAASATTTIRGDTDAAYKDYAKKLLELMAKAAGSAKRNPKKSIRNAISDSEKQIDACHSLWEKYRIKPTKIALRKVMNHLEKMGHSTSKKVLTERANCLRAANREAKKLKL